MKSWIVLVLALFLLPLLPSANEGIKFFKTDEAVTWITYQQKQGWLHVPDSILPALWIAMQEANCFSADGFERTGLFMHPFVNRYFLLACHSADQLGPKEALLLCEIHGLSLRGQDGMIVSCWPKGSKES